MDTIEGNKLIILLLELQLNIALRKLNAMKNCTRQERHTHILLLEAEIEGLESAIKSLVN